MGSVSLARPRCPAALRLPRRTAKSGRGRPRPPGGQSASPGREGGRPAIQDATPIGHANPRAGARVSDEQARRGADAAATARARDGIPPVRSRCPTRSRSSPLLLDIYTEQVAGYYDPDSTTFFGVVGADRSQLRLVLAHEMVHALQGQYLPLDSILKATANNDRLTAAQSILEGQATLASIDVLAPGQGVSANPQFWEMYRDQIQQQQGRMPVFARAPLVIRQSMIFPYLDGRGVHALVGIVAPRRHAALRPADARLHRADPASGALREGRPAGGARLRGAGRHLRRRPRRK